MPQSPLVTVQWHPLSPLRPKSQRTRKFLSPTSWTKSYFLPNPPCPAWLSVSPTDLFLHPLIPLSISTSNPFLSPLIQSLIQDIKETTKKEPSLLVESPPYIYVKPSLWGPKMGAKVWPLSWSIPHSWPVTSITGKLTIFLSQRNPAFNSSLGDYFLFPSVNLGWLSTTFADPLYLRELKTHHWGSQEIG